MNYLDRPFDITKAVDFSDKQILETWVEPPGGRFRVVANPKSPMPLFLLGGKGSGRTHLMRVFSYSVQKLRATGEVLVAVESDGYIGIYMRCEGINAGRFEGKGYSSEVWDTIFAYYFDLWLSELTLLTVQDVLSGTDVHPSTIKSVAEAICDLVDDTPKRCKDLADVISLLRALRREVDTATNNAAISRSNLNLEIKTRRSSLIFGIPEILVRFVGSFARVQFRYLIDELENLTVSQQMYINTLVRERQPPSTFVIGSRIYGFRTRKTLSAGEENRDGSEYEEVRLDDQLRVNPKYDDFARSLIVKRLRGSGHTVPTGKNADRFLDSLFENSASASGKDDDTAFISKYQPSHRPYFERLRRQLRDGITRGLVNGISDSYQIEELVASLSFPSRPLIEKTNIFFLYRAWYTGEDLTKAARRIAKECARFTDGKRSEAEAYGDVLSHYKSDLLAQLLRDCKQPQRYLGLQTFIDMSSGLPRHLLILLKFVHRWSLFYDEQPFAGRPISRKAQRAGVSEAANWFFDDARVVSADASFVQGSIDKLARFLRELRFSDKPVECSLCTFSYDEAKASTIARKCIEQAQGVSLLLRVIHGQKDRNKRGVLAKYQLNPMLCPRFDLPIARRGAISLTAREVEAIFGEEPSNFGNILSERLEGMNAPFFRSTKRRPADAASSNTLPLGL